MPSVMIIQGPDKGRTFPLAEGENGIGRQSRPVMLSDGTASRHHCRVFGEKGRWVLTDLGAANATYLNGEKVSRPTVLQRGDQIRCGSTLMVFSMSNTGESVASSVDVDEHGRLVDAAIVASMPSNEDSVILPTPEAGAAAIGNLRFLYDLIAEIGACLDIKELAVRTLDRIFEVLQADRGYVLLIEDPEDAEAGEDSRLEPIASRVTRGDAKQRAPISRTILREVLGRQVGVISSNAMSDKRFESGKSVHDLGIRSALCVPIKGRGKPLGVIQVDCSVSDHTYTTEQLRLLTAIGYQAGLAIENVRLHESTVQSERLAAVGETVAVLSHHTKNILHGLTAGADIVESGLNKGDIERAKQAWPIVQRNLARINEMILNMLAFSKDREPGSEAVNVNDVIGECVELLVPRAEERQVALLADTEEMPDIQADPAGLHQLFLNLIVNALDAVADGTGAVTVSSRFDSLEREVTVSVIDNGRGIDPEQLRQIFNPFYSGKGQGGTGLGLAVAKKIAEEHTGRIEVASTVGEGTTFTVHLPPRAKLSADDTHAAVAGK